MKKVILFCLFFGMFFSCSSIEKSKKYEIKKKNAKAEFILRRSNSYTFSIPKPVVQKREAYPWEEEKVENLSPITKNYFRCKGSKLSPTLQDSKDTYYDCHGNHGPALIHDKEGVYPVLIDLLNYIQQKTKKRVIITSGYRCPTHNLYADRSNENQSSFHLIGAEVDFYVLGLEDRPYEVLNLIFEFYKDKKGYRGKKEYEQFARLGKDSSCSTLPWANKEIVVKFYKKNEGRDGDNKHPFPYICVSVKYDRDRKEDVYLSKKLKGLK
jgi:uncharacterized protein YcbK (DUF882 family)